MAISKKRRRGDRLRELRKERGLTQERLASLAGISHKTVQNLERGDSPQLETARKLAKALKVQASTILFPEEQAS